MTTLTIPFAALLLASAVAAGPAAADPAAPSDPASALCVKNGAIIATETLANGAKHNTCVFPNGSRVDAAAYFRNKHRSH